MRSDNEIEKRDRYITGYQKQIKRFKERIEDCQNRINELLGQRL